MAALAEVTFDDRTVLQPQAGSRFVVSGVPTPAVLRLAVPLTDDELMRFSAENSLCRIERNAQGELEIMSPAGGRGGNGEAYLIRELDLWAEEHGGVSFSSQAGFRLPDTSIKMADAAWIESERWEALSDAEQSAYPPLCPAFVIELLSPSDSRTALEAKMLLWMANGARLAWLIDPFAKDVLVFKAGEVTEHLFRPDVVTADLVLPGFRLKMERLWRQERNR